MELSQQGAERATNKRSTLPEGRSHKLRTQKDVASLALLGPRTPTKPGASAWEATVIDSQTWVAQGLEAVTNLATITPGLVSARDGLPSPTHQPAPIR